MRVCFPREVFFFGSTPPRSDFLLIHEPSLGPGLYSAHP
jgi:hypothetical protein